MTHPSYIILYVNDPQASTAFYEKLLACAPVERSPAFALFVLEGGFKLGLWARDQVIPAVAGGPGSAAMELCLTLADDAQVDAWHARWSAQGIAMVQAPLRQDFGYAFVGRDPDGHRLRVFSPGQM